ncbi:flagellar export protein FliJ [Aquibacillus salsiterrae]|uniref:Flagellar FliJ protein n=1 Tax=Aquibacillus salsiterrae TaxID=2950439 RepID=A0A9X4AEC9_9BACI|nr:flagellar export protein FliJ [Aquibacillus salsiterrae]MDC3416394.1 flagellar export protein FliJ [Aquibacillus salsiterrae]
MAAIHSYHKILTVREREKNVAQSAYSQSVESFEKIANQLYELLKQKEAMEENYQVQLCGNGTVSTLLSHSDYLLRLKAQIALLEKKVNKARTEMNGKQEELTEAHKEVKKIEKLMEQKRQYDLTIKWKQEANLMDETSVLQFINRKDR